MALFRGDAGRRLGLALYLLPAGATEPALTRATGMSRWTVISALKALVEDGVVTRTVPADGFHRYAANRAHPLAAELRDLALRTLGGNDALVLDAVRCPAITRLAVFGSYARGSEQAGSDLDILVVVRERGDRAAAEAVNRLAGAVVAIGVELAAQTVTEGELAAGSRFLDNVRRGAHVALKGDLA